MSDKTEKTVLAFGAGVQSTALLMLALTRDIRFLAAGCGLPDLVVFADPGSEGAATYDHVDAMERRCVEAGVPFRRARFTKHGREMTLMEEIATEQRFSTIPAFSKNLKTGTVGMLGRSCTRDHKIRPIARAIRQWLGVRAVMARTHLIHLQLGISKDEADRAKSETQITWQTRQFPLLDLNWSRRDCERYLQGIGVWPVPKSACTFCPYQADWRWRQKYAARGHDWLEAVQMDETLRGLNGRGNISGGVYLHRSAIPLAELPFMKDGVDGDDAFSNECEGYCGV